MQYLRRFGCNRMTVVELVFWEMRTDSAEGLGKDLTLVMKDELHEEMDVFDPQWIDDRTGGSS